MRLLGVSIDEPIYAFRRNSALFFFLHFSFFSFFDQRISKMINMNLKDTQNIKQVLYLFQGNFISSINGIGGDLIPVWLEWITYSTFFWLQHIRNRFWIKQHEVRGKIRDYHLRTMNSTSSQAEAYIDPVEHLRWRFFAKNSSQLKAVNYFCKNTPS